MSRVTAVPAVVRAQIAGIVAATLGGLGLFLDRVNAFSAVPRWEFWRYVGIETWVLFWAASAWAAGHALVVAITRHRLPLREHAVVSFVVGVLGFFLLTEAAGLLGILGHGYFVWGPLTLLAVGARPAARSLLRLRRHYVFARRRSLRPHPGVFLATVGGVFGLALVWWCTLSPEGTAADSLWYHLSLAEQYAHTGRIDAFREGWIMAAYPHLASVLYTWAFLLPGYSLFHHVVIATQMEFVCACVAWASVPALVRAVLPRTRLPWAWAFAWLFPASFVYLPNAGADLVAAMWAGPLFLLMLRALPRLDLGYCLLFGLVAAGTVNTKYSACVVLLLPIIALAQRAAVLLFAALRSPDEKARRRVMLAVVTLVGTPLAATSPHWLKNAVFYGDPVYPLGRSWFPSRPWTALAERMQGNFWNKGELWRPPPTWSGLRESLMAVFDFSFVSRHFGHPDVKWMFFGSLFTLSLPLLPLVRSPRRLWALHGAVLLAIFGWFWLHHQDRYLITLMPWMAAATACAFHLAWRVHRVTRIAIASLVAVQLVWGADIYVAYAKHAATSSLVTSARTGNRKKVLDFLQQGHRAVAKRLPEDAVVLVHDYQSLLGLGHKTIADAVAWQGGIDYLTAPTDLGVYQTLTELGATHLMWLSAASQDWDSQGANLVFWGFVTRHAVGARKAGAFTVARMPSAPPPATPEVPRVLVAICKGNYRAGVHRVTALNIPGLDNGRIRFPKPEIPISTTNPGQVAEALSWVDFVLLNQKCQPKVAPLLGKDFELAARRGQDEQWVRIAPR